METTMTLKVQTLRPGLLVALKTSTRGNVSYFKKDLANEKKGDAEVTEWTTERTIANRKEFERAKKAVKAATLPIRQACNWSAFGLLCPESDRPVLDKAIAESQEIVKAFNDKAELTRINVYALVATIAADDVTAVKAISSEVRDLMATMEKGIAKLDVKAIRYAASKAKEIGGMLTPQAQGRVQVAIDLARKAAKQIKKAGEEAGKAIDKAAINKIREQRTSFLDIEEEIAEVAKPKQRARVVDLNV